MDKWGRFLARVVIVAWAPFVASAATIQLGTTGNAASWKLTGAGASAATPFQVSANGAGEISLTSNGFNNGTVVTGGTLGGFNGFWYADNTFALPANATTIAMSFDSLYGNDRAVLQLNGVTIGNVDHLGNTGSGVMQFPGTGTDAPFTFTGVTSGVINSGFIAGGNNTLRLIVNNTGTTSISSPTATFANSTDATDAFINATVTYAVPEPSSAAALTIGAALYLTGKRRRKSSTVRA